MKVICSVSKYESYLSFQGNLNNHSQRGIPISLNFLIHIFKTCYSISERARVSELESNYHTICLYTHHEAQILNMPMEQKV